MQTQPIYREGLQQVCLELMNSAGERGRDGDLSFFRFQKELKAKPEV